MRLSAKEFDHGIGGHGRGGRRATHAQNTWHGVFNAWVARGKARSSRRRALGHLAPVSRAPRSSAPDAETDRRRRHPQNRPSTKTTRTRARREPKTKELTANTAPLSTHRHDFSTAGTSPTVRGGFSARAPLWGWLSGSLGKPERAGRTREDQGEGAPFHPKVNACEEPPSVVTPAPFEAPGTWARAPPTPQTMRRLPRMPQRWSRARRPSRFTTCLCADMREAGEAIGPSRFATPRRGCDCEEVLFSGTSKSGDKPRPNRGTLPSLNK